MPVEDRFDFLEFNPEAADLDPLVDPSEEGEIAIGLKPGQVTGPVDSGVRIVTKRMRNKPLGGQVGPPEVTPGQSVAANVQLAGDTGRLRLH
jgi:hypothetical protein